VALRRRQDAASPVARDRGQRAKRRLHARWIAFDDPRKQPAVANTAIPRELAGWCGDDDSAASAPAFDL
jgi:hypothetical protein